VQDDNQDAEEEPDSDEQDEDVSQETPRAAIIGRVGLAGAREAPQPLEGSQEGAPAHAVSESAQTDAPGDDAPKLSETTEDVDPDLIARLHPGDIDASGHIADPEMPRSAPSPGHDPNPSRNLFGRIGHPGSSTKAHELESPNPKSDSESTAKQQVVAPKDTQWNEEELKRDPAKTIISPDAGKGAFAEKK
jgi:hypothetical protein